MGIFTDARAIRRGKAKAKAMLQSVAIFERDHHEHHVADADWDCGPSRDAYYEHNREIWAVLSPMEKVGFAQVMEADREAEMQRRIESGELMMVPFTFDGVDMDDPEAIQAKIEQVVGDALTTSEMEARESIERDIAFLETNNKEGDDK